jgi:PAS domain S-box-containing protein
VTTLALPQALGKLVCRHPAAYWEDPEALERDVCIDLAIWLDLRRQREARRQLERERDERDVLLAALFDQAPIAMLLLDAQQRVVRANAAAAAVSGHEADKITGAALADLRRREGPPVLLPLFDEVHKSGRAVIHRHVSLPVLGRLDTPRDLLVSVLPLLHPDGSCFGTAATALDVTELVQARHLLTQLARQLIQVEEDERTALARELHDDFGQRLAALKMILQLRLRADDASTGRAMLDEAIGIAESCITQVRKRAFALRPAQLDELGLAAVLECHAREQSRLSGVAVSVSVSLLDLQPGADWNSHVFRIVQEAVRNALEHGQPKAVDITLFKSDAEVMLTVRDDGVGLPALSERVGMGLLNMRERAALLGGHFDILPVQPHGAQVRCRWPLSVVGIKRAHKEAAA